MLLRTNYGDLEHERTQAYYDMQWRLLPLRKSDMPPCTSPVPRPLEFDTMRFMAERLADGRDHIRIDFFVSDGCVYVGELTIYHHSGLFRYEPDIYDCTLGEWWQLRRPLLRAVCTIIRRDWGIAQEMVA